MGNNVLARVGTRLNQQPVCGVMSDSDYEMHDSDDGDDYDDDEDDTCWAESAPVRQATSCFEVLDAGACLAVATQQVNEVCELLCVGKDVASILLRQFRWDRERLTADYLEDSEGVLRKAGFHEGENLEMLHVGAGLVHVSGLPQPASSLPEIKCLICYEDHKMYSALACGHKYCNDCYTTFMSHKIKDEGHACLFTTCPHDRCPVMVTERLVHSLPLSQEQRDQYDKAGLLERSYVDDNPNIKWCTAPDCGLAIRAQRGTLGVKCSCGNRFCFSCGQGDHTPCSCADLQKWILKCRDDSETYLPCVQSGTCFGRKWMHQPIGGSHGCCESTQVRFRFWWCGERRNRTRGDLRSMRGSETH